ncbi:Protein of unknown function PDDEXK-like [Dillenia turbinata]|uniref:Uncharacterized protein n=1 Tax=Dillenia turbinata TaxID=194707 RepID=A0AAN8VMH2_9MAGN
MCSSALRRPTTMTASTGKTPATLRFFRQNSDEIVLSDDDQSVSLSDMVLGFFEDKTGDVFSQTSTVCLENDDLDVGDEDVEQSESVEERKAFWESQHQLLQGTLYRSSSLETKIRKATKEALKDIKMRDNICRCERPVANGCRNCLIGEISCRLRNAGFNCSICKTKWKSSPYIPSGEHTFLDVIDSSNPKKGEIRIIIELNFRAEFEMARARPEYNELISRLPEVYVGKVERLSSLIKILCSAAKKCMKENKMHLGPWRKQKYMQAKWLGTCQRMAPAPTSVACLSREDSSRLPKPKASKLTMDLLEKMPGMSMVRSAVEVV